MPIVRYVKVDVDYVQRWIFFCWMGQK